jgi:raffinose/stachyose/melibiose transport system permease protein
MRKRSVSVIKHAFLIVLLGFMMYPIYMVIVNSFKTENELYANVLGLPSTLDLQNYVSAIVDGKLLRAFGVSVVITAVSVVVVTILASFVAFCITRKRTRFRQWLYALFCAGIMIPYQVGLIQLYQLINKMGLVDHLLGLILIYVAWGLPLAVFVMSGFFSTIPKEIVEAATIDGCSSWLLYSRIIMPLSSTVISASVILNLVWIWNDMLYPMIFIDSPEMKPLSTALLAFKGQFVSRYTVMFAGVVLASLPLVIVYLLLQKKFIAGMMAGSVKG